MTGTKEIATTLPDLEVRQADHTLVVGWEWEWKLFLPEDVLRRGYAFAFVLDETPDRCNFVCQALVTLGDDPDVPPHLLARLSGAQTALLVKSPLYYALEMWDPTEAQPRCLAYGRMDLMTPDEYYKSIRRVKYKIEIANPFRNLS